VEAIVTSLIQELERLGHQNSLIASGDSRTPATLIAATDTSLVELMAGCRAHEYSYFEQHQLLLALDRACDFDIVHSHIGPAGYVLSGVPRLQGRVVHTQHNPVTPDMEWFVSQHADLWFSTVSEFQARKIRDRGAIHCSSIHNGIGVSKIPFSSSPDAGLIYVGRMEEEKGPDLAIRVARELDMPLVLAGPVIDEDFFDLTIRPCLDDRIRYVGSVQNEEKFDLFGRARCALVPSRCDEGFGMVSIEAMACGTPVAALANGALPEIVEPGLSGYLSDGEDGLAVAVRKTLQLDRATVRQRAAERFDIAACASKYVRLYSEMTSAVLSPAGRF
jgi:glycosyltransferase involved in cell wall biosynthesis